MNYSVYDRDGAHVGDASDSFNAFHLLCVGDWRRRRPLPAVFVDHAIGAVTHTVEVQPGGWSTKPIDDVTGRRMYQVRFVTK